MEAFLNRNLTEYLHHMKQIHFQTLDYNVRLADLQQTYARLAARTLERNTFVQVKTENQTDVEVEPLFK